MDIEKPLTTPLLAVTKNNFPSTPPQLNQLLSVNVVKALPNLTNFTLQLEGQTIQVQANRPMNISDGQSLTLQVVKVGPSPEFKIVNLSTPQQSDSSVSSPPQKQLPGVFLKQIPLQPSQSNTSIKAQPLSQLVSGQHLQIKLTHVSGKGITGQLFSSPQITESKQSITLVNQQISNLSKPKVGQVITLEVVKPGNPPQFKLLDYSPDSVISDTIKLNLPIQESPTPFFSHLLKNLSELEKNEKIPETLKRLAQEILSNLPHKSQITNAELLKNQILNSGRFLEAKIARLLNNPDIELQDDFKLRLLKLIETLKQQTDPKVEQKLQSDELNLLREMLQKSSTSLAGIILDQLNSLPKEEGNKQVWLFELPFLNNNKTEKVTIEIEQDEEPDNPEQKNNWSVNITLSPPNLGTIHCKLNCYDQVVSTHFWSEQPATVEKISTHLDYLKQRLEKNDINSGLMDVQQGKPNTKRQQEFPGNNLLNEDV